MIYNWDWLAIGRACLSVGPQYCSSTLRPLVCRIWPQVERCVVADYSKWYWRSKKEGEWSSDRWRWRLTGETKDDEWRRWKTRAPREMQRKRGRDVAASERRVVVVARYFVCFPVGVRPPGVPPIRAPASVSAADVWEEGNVCWDVRPFAESFENNYLESGLFELKHVTVNNGRKRGLAVAITLRVLTSSHSLTCVCVCVCVIMWTDTIAPYTLAPGAHPVNPG